MDQDLWTSYVLWWKRPVLAWLSYAYVSGGILGTYGVLQAGCFLFPAWIIAKTIHHVQKCLHRYAKLDIVFMLMVSERARACHWPLLHRRDFMYFPGGGLTDVGSSAVTRSFIMGYIGTSPPRLCLVVLLTWRLALGDGFRVECVVMLHEHARGSYVFCVVYRDAQSTHIKAHQTSKSQRRFP
jgi:hypothetical protein